MSGEPIIPLDETPLQDTEQNAEHDAGAGMEDTGRAGVGESESIELAAVGPRVDQARDPDEPTSAQQDDAAEQRRELPQTLELDKVAATLTSFDGRLEESQRLLARQSDLLDKLHAENQRLRAGELRVAALPLVRDLLRLHDDILRLAADSEDTQDLDVVKISLLDALARNGITTFTPEPGEQFDPKQHNVAGILQTEDVSLDRTVVEATRVGVQWEDGQAIRVADVRVYKHIPAAESTTQPASSHRSTNGDSQ